MNVLITGIDGFTGKYLERHLFKNGFTVFGTVIGKPEEENHIKCDICNIDEVEEVINIVKPDYVFHLAAISFVGESDKSMIYDVNVIGTQNILDTLINLGMNPKKIVVASSATVYGNQNSQTLDEAMCPKPVNHYGYSKLAMENLVTTYFNRLNILITRPFNYTGYGHSEIFIIPKIVSHYANKKQILELGNLDVAREFNDIRTVIDIYYQLMLSNAKSDVVNLCTGNVIKLKEVLEYMELLAEYKIQIKTNPQFVRKNEIPILKGSTAKLENIITIPTKHTINDTLKVMYKGYLND